MEKYKYSALSPEPSFNLIKLELNSITLQSSSISFKLLFEKVRSSFCTPLSKKLDHVPELVLPEFKTEMDLEKIDSVLKQLFTEEDVFEGQELAIEFFMMSDSMDKLDEMEEILEEMGMMVDSIECYEDGCELIGTTEAMKMNKETVSAWYKSMWLEGYKLDCKIDGWHVLVD